MAADLAFGIGNLRARAEQQRLQGAMLKVATAVSAGIGTEFFERLAHNMAQALDAQIACVARLLPPAEGQPPRAVTLSHVTQGVVQPNAEYSLDGTPSRQLLTHRQFVIVDHAATLYPHAPVLTRAGARSYVGQQLTASDGTPVGLIFVMFAQPLEHADFVENTPRAPRPSWSARRRTRASATRPRCWTRPATPSSCATWTTASPSGTKARSACTAGRARRCWDAPSPRCCTRTRATSSAPRPR
jgi:hypothetical protein